MHSRSRLLFLVFLATTFVNSLLAGPTATLTGRVTDTSGAVIAGVKVETTNVETTVTYSGETNAEGLYNISNLPPGIYRVIVQKFAFRTIVKPDVELHVQDTIALNFSMELGSVTQSVTVEAGAPLIQANPQRGGAFVSREVSNLPLVSMNPISLARALPGVIEPAGSTLYATGANDEATIFSANGARIRANNYLLDSTENNDFVYTGIAQAFNIADAVEEVSVQTGNFGVEFGRASGGVFNVVTKSGTNTLNGTVLWRYQSELFNSVSNFDRLNGTPRTAFNRNVYGFTVGGPVRRSKTFFFGAFQQDTFASRHFTLVVPTEGAITTLRSLFPSNPRLDMYLNLLGPLRGLANPIPVQLGNDPITGVDRGVVQFASVPLNLRETNAGPQWIARLDHNRSEAHRLAFRYIYDSRTHSPSVVYFPGFYLDQATQNQNLLSTDQYTLSPTWTNEFRFSYSRLDAHIGRISTDSIPLASTLPRINMESAGISAPGVVSILVQHRHADNFLFQDTLTTLKGRHTFRYGVEFLRQLATQTPAARFLGELPYTSAPALGYSAFANFLDDFSGRPGNAALKDFACRSSLDILCSPGAFHPNSFRQTYFFQDVWLPAPSLSLTLGLRYENFGQPANALRFPAFSGFDPQEFFKPNRVNTDNNNFGPAFGLAWSPSFRSGLLHKLFAENKTVWRGGYQISYEAFFTNALSLLLATTTPNGISWTSPTANTGRGLSDWSTRLPMTAPAPSLLDSQRGALQKDFRNAYTERWSFGFQRQLSSNLVLDGSYVGSESHKLVTWKQANPTRGDGSRPHPDFGLRQIRTSDGNSAYHAIQWRVDRRFARGFQLTGAYTWSRNIDSTSEGVGTESEQDNLVESVERKRERGLSAYDRTHRFTILYVWSVPGPVAGFWKYLLGAWSIAGITSFQSGAPFTVQSARIAAPQGLNRPDIGNPDAPLNTRAILSPNCATGYLATDTNVCVTAANVHWIQGTGPANAATVGRNTLRAGGINNFDVSLSKSFQIAEQKRLEFRLEARNALNHPQSTQVPARDVNSLTPGRFLNRDFTDSGIRSMWVQLKLVF